MRRSRVWGNMIFDRLRGIRRTDSGSTLPKSVFFYTFHKCASTLFSSYVLKNVDGLHHIDYACEIYEGSRSPRGKLAFEKRGFIYGPIRISTGEASPIGRLLVKPTVSHRFIRDKTALFFVRDPRDILVSSYYSFGFTHEFSKVRTIREQQEANRKTVREQTLDEYVLNSAKQQIMLFRALYGLSVACRNSMVLRYEDMINDFDAFAAQLRGCISLGDEVIQECYLRSRPKKTEDTGSHRRSGKVQDFRFKLNVDTIDKLNGDLAETLALFGYKT